MKIVVNHTFGGEWTGEKLEVLRRYLDAYTTALKRQRFNLTYIDAFAGTGYWSPQQSSHNAEYREYTQMLEGSAAIALEVDDRPFDRLVFIERDVGRCRSLAGLHRLHSERDIAIVNEDANSVLPRICDSMGDFDRAVVFLDPYRTEVSWRTVERIAETEKIDCWMLFPLMAISRMMPINVEPNEEWARNLDRIFGGRAYWHNTYVAPSQGSLFGDDQPLQRESGSAQIANLYRVRLESVFREVAPRSRTLRNSMNSPLFELFFAAGNPTGARIAVGIADSILRNF